MNTLVEKMFGIIMFLAIFVPFQFGLYSSQMDAFEFTQVTTEITQLIREEGGLQGRALDYVNEMEKIIEDDETGEENSVYGYNVKLETPRLDSNGKVVTEEIDIPDSEDTQTVVVYDVFPRDVKASVGQILKVTYEKEIDGTYNWGSERKYKKISNITVYKR